MSEMPSNQPAGIGEQRQPVVVQVYLSPAAQTYAPPHMQRVTTLTTSPRTSSITELATAECLCDCGSASGGGSGR